MMRPDWVHLWHWSKFRVYTTIFKVLICSHWQQVSFDHPTRTRSMSLSSSPRSKCNKELHIFAGLPAWFANVVTSSLLPVSCMIWHRFSEIPFMLDLWSSLRFFAWAAHIMEVAFSFSSLHPPYTSVRGMGVKLIWIKSQIKSYLSGRPLGIAKWKTNNVLIPANSMPRERYDYVYQ